MSNLIKNSGVSLLSFAAKFTKAEVVPFTNKETGENFKSLVFTNERSGEVEIVNFSANLGELTPSEIKTQRADLQVVEMESGTHILCRKGHMPEGEEVLLWD